jgi:hypothetical protein
MFHGKRCRSSLVLVAGCFFVCSWSAHACDKPTQKPQPKPDCRSKVIQPAHPAPAASVVVKPKPAPQVKVPKPAPQVKVLAHPKPVVSRAPAVKPAIIVRSAVHSHGRPVPQGLCPPAPCCCEDARVCVVEQSKTVCYTEAGLRAFAAVFRDAAAQGVENATIRAFNATKVAPNCGDCTKPKK